MVFFALCRKTTNPRMLPAATCVEGNSSCMHKYLATPIATRHIGAHEQAGDLVKSLAKTVSGLGRCDGMRKGLDTVNA